MSWVKLRREIGRAIRNKLSREPKLKIRNNTQYPIHIMLSKESFIIPINNIQPGKKVARSSWYNIWFQGNTLRTLEKLGSKTVIKLAEGLLSEESDEQRNRVVMEMYPEQFGFKEVLPGELLYFELYLNTYRIYI